MYPYPTEKAERTPKPLKVRIVTFVSAIAFLGTFSYSTAQMFLSAFEQPTEEQTAQETNNAQAELNAQAKGYETVLQREPENQVALEGLLNVRLAMNDPKGAIAPLEKLVELNRDRADYKTLLDNLKQGNQENP